MSLSKSINSKILVLVVDIDDDLGREGIETPVIGYNNVLNTAISFGMKKPHDSDLNAIFHALKVYNELKQQGMDVEIALIAGRYGNFSLALLRINKQLEDIKRKLGFTEIYFVSDGAYDEQITPILHNYGKVIGVDRVIVAQSRGIEETYMLISKYLKKAFTEQPYVKFFLGIPGLILVLYVIASLIGVAEYIWHIIALVIGMTLLIHGFGFVEKLNSYWRVSPIAGFLYGLSILLLVYTVIVNVIILRIYNFNVFAVKLMLNLSFLPFILGLFLFLSGRIFYKVMSNAAHTIWRESVAMIPLIFFAVFTINFNQELARVEDQENIEKIFEILNTSSLSIPLILAIIFTLALSVLFVILDTIILKEGSSTKSSLS